MIKPAYIRSSLLAALDGVIHGYSTRSDGDMRKPEFREAFAKKIGLDGGRLVKPRQVHGVIVSRVGPQLHDRMLAEADGAVSSGIPLSVISADCVPAMAVDPKAGVIGVAHAGWKGTIGNIAGTLVAAMVEQGADRKEIRVAVGPRIDSDHYAVPEDRARMFDAAFGTHSGVVSRRGDAWHLDIGRANQLLFLKSGITDDRIDMLPYFTAARPDMFFSYRTDSDASYGEITGVIGIASV